MNVTGAARMDESHVMNAHVSKDEAEVRDLVVERVIPELSA